MPGADKPLSFDAEGGFDNAAKRAQLTVDLSSLAELFKSLGSSFGGKVTGDLGNPDDWKLEAIQDGDTVYLHFPLIAEQLPAGQDLGQGRRQGSLERGRRPARASSARSQAPTRVTSSGS